MNYNGKEYQSIMEEIVDDIFYKDTSYRTKIMLIRSLSEIFVKKIINYSHDGKKNQFSLGSDYMKALLKKIDENNKTGTFLHSTVNKLREDGNNRTHTGDLSKTDEEEYKSCLEALYHLMAYLFIEYFKKNEFGKDEEMRIFSILPPIIREITLKELLREEPKNLFIWHKLCLATLKKNGKKVTMDWLKAHKDELIGLSTNYNKGNFKQFVTDGTLDMYTHLEQTICIVDMQRSLSLVDVYSTFEESLSFYKKTILKSAAEKKILSNFEELKELIDFLFQGRKIIN